MNRDTQLYVKVFGQYRNLDRRKAVVQVAKDERMSVSGVSGCVTRAHRTLGARLALMEYLGSQHNEFTPALQEINCIVAAGQAKVDQHRTTLQADGNDKAAVFISDMHSPATDWKALELTYKAVEYLDKWLGVAYVSALNDVFDFPLLAPYHTDKRQPSEKVFDTDISRAYDLHAEHMQIIRLLAPNAINVAIGGNHDKRPGTYGDQASDATPVSFTLVADAMEKLTAQGVTFVDSLAKENVFEVTSRLAWMHGQTTAANPVTRVKKALKAFQLSKPERAGRITDIVSGHLHKDNITNHPDVVGMTLYESPCLCRFDMPYLKVAPAWTTGIVVSVFNPVSGTHETTLVRYSRVGSGYEARVFGNRLEVK